MKKPIYFISVIVILVLAILGYNYNKNSVKSFEQTLSINPSKITALAIENPKGESKDFISTTDQVKIQELVIYLNGFNFKRKSIDDIEASKLYPGKDIYTPTILLYQGDKVNILMPVGKEIMINTKAFTVVNGEIDFNFLREFYDKVKD